MWRATSKTTKVGILLTTLLLSALTIVGVSAAAESETMTTPTPEVVESWATSPEYRTKVKTTYDRAVYNQTQARAWHYRVDGAPRLPGLHRKLPMSQDLQMEQNRLKVWTGNRVKAKTRYVAWNAKWERLNRNMWQAVEAAAKEYGVSASWLHACVSTEGGHGGWVMNHGGSGAGGWFQFMRPTFYGYVQRARSVNRFPAKYAYWESRVGQAYTAAYMFKIGQSGQWTGAGC